MSVGKADWRRSNDTSRGSLDDSFISSAASRDTLSKPRRKTSLYADEEEGNFTDGECTPLVRRGADGSPHEKRIWTMTVWTREMNRGKSKLWVLVVSAFANMGPGGCLVVHNKENNMIGALILMMVFMGVSLSMAYLYAQALTISGTWTVASCWREAFGPRTSWMPLLLISVCCYSCAVGYAELASHMVSTVFYWTPIPTLLDRPDEFWALLLGIFPLSILVCLKDISIMKPATTVTMFSCAFTFVAVVVRFADGNYAPGGHWFQFRQAHNFHLHDAGLYSSRKSIPEGLTRALAGQSVLFLCHFNLGKYYGELESPKADRFTAAVGLAMGLSFFFCAGIMIFTTLTFGYQVADFTLDNYAPDDILINCARVGTSIGIMGCYPLLFCGMREAVIEFLINTFPRGKDSFETVVFQNSFSLAMLAVSMLIQLNNARFSLFLLRLGRTCFGSLLIYTLPVMLFVGASRKHLSAPIGKAKLLGLFFLFCFGIGMAVCAAWFWITFGFI